MISPVLGDAAVQSLADLATEVDNAAGLMIDTWRTIRSGMPYDRLGEVVPVERVTAVGLDDGAAHVVGTLSEDTVNNRRRSREGQFDTAAFIQHAVRAGFHGSWGVEISSTEHRGLPAAQGLWRPYDTTRGASAAALPSA